jgi:hypothetical protein
VLFIVIKVPSLVILVAPYIFAYTDGTVVVLLLLPVSVLFLQLSVAIESKKNEQIKGMFF